MNQQKSNALNSPALHSFGAALESFRKGLWAILAKIRPITAYMGIMGASTANFQAG